MGRIGSVFHWSNTMYSMKVLYLKVLENVRIAKTVVLKEGVNVDVSSDYRIVGIELLLPSLA